MSKNLNTKLPDAITKRDILYGQKKVTDDHRKALGSALEKEEWYSDAVDFLTQNPEELAEIKKAAIAEGNVFLLTKIFRVLNEENSNELAEAARNAESQGKTRYAIKAYEKLGNEEKAAELKAQIAEDGDMKTALNSVFIPKTEEEREEEEEHEG